MKQQFLKKMEENIFMTYDFEISYSRLPET